MLILDRITHIVLYRPYRADKGSPKEYALFNDAREACSFAGSHSRVCSTMNLLKVDCELTQELINELVKG